MEQITILENKQFNGVEIYFNAKPNQKTITALKEKRFKWHTLKKCWYNKNTQEIKKFIETLTNGETITATAEKVGENAKKQLLALQPLTEEEKINFVKSEWNNEKMQNFIFEKYNYYKTTDGFIIEIEKASKLGINKTLYYDDETTAPQINFANFEEANKYKYNKYNYFNEKAKDDYNKFYFTHNTTRENKRQEVQVLAVWDLSKNGYLKITTRELTQDEKQDILTLYKQQKDEYTARLQKYWNKYKNHITTCGYWANR